MFHPPKDAYIFCHTPAFVAPLTMQMLQSWTKLWCYLDVDETKAPFQSKAGLIPPSQSVKSTGTKAAMSGPRLLSVSAPAAMHVFPPLAALPAELE